LAVRIAREIHWPITEILNLPESELQLWAAVFQEESGQSEEPEEREISGKEVFALLGGEVVTKHEHS
jgi:hypothetical protein